MGMVKQVGRSFCVAHSNGTVVSRSGRRACFPSRSTAVQDMKNMECRVMGKCPAGTTSISLITAMGRQRHKEALRRR